MVVGSFSFIFRAAEQIQPLLCQPHPCAGPVSAIGPGFSCHNGMADGGVILPGVLEQTDFVGDLFGQHRESKFPDNFGFGPWLPIRFFHRWKADHPQGFVDALDATVLQMGY